MRGFAFVSRDSVHSQHWNNCLSGISQKHERPKHCHSRLWQGTTVRTSNRQAKTYGKGGVIKGAMCGCNGFFKAPNYSRELTKPRTYSVLGAYTENVIEGHKLALLPHLQVLHKQKVKTEAE